jgi:glycosyltransferase involved in cell wall biosynthesis
MDISIVIPVLNGEKNIKRCIESLVSALADEKQINIFVVDNGSSDETVSILEKMNIKYSVCKGCTISKLRNIGAMSCSSELIGFVDSDCFVKNDWFKEAKIVFQENQNVAVVGRYYNVPDDPSWVEKIWFDMRKDVEGSVRFLPGGNMIFRRNIFEKISGFDENLVTGEDYDICERVRKKGCIIYNSPRVNVEHLGNYKKLSTIIKKERWYGKGMFSNELRMTKPLLATLLFTVFTISLLIVVLVDYQMLLYLFPLYLIFMVFVAYGFSKNVKRNRIVFIFKMIPIAFCYLSGRSMSLLDFLISYFKKKIGMSL